MVRPLGFRLLAVTAAVVAVSQAYALSIISVSTEQQLIDAINAANSAASSSTTYIEIKGNISLSAPLPKILVSMDIDGGGFTVTGASGGRVFELGDDSAGRAIRVDLSNLNVDGGSVNNAADATGGAVLISSKASVTVQNVKVSNASASSSSSAALGGGFFVADGGQLTIEGASTISGNTVSSGAGQAAGSGLFLDGAGELIINGPREGRTLTISDDIADSTALDPASADAWGLRIKGGGGDVVLSGNNTYGGETVINNATLVLNSASNLGSSSGAVVINDGGLALANGLDFNRDLLVRSDGAHIRVDAGTAQLSGELIGASHVEKTGAGKLDLNTNTNFSGSWGVSGGTLILDSDARLGTGSGLHIEGGTIEFENGFSGTLRALTIKGETDEDGVVTGGASFNSNGQNINLTNNLTGTGNVVFTGGGAFHLTGANKWENTDIQSSTVQGAIGQGALNIGFGGQYDLANANRSISDLTGMGQVNLGSNTLTINVVKDKVSEDGFMGSISGSGSLVVKGDAAAYSPDMFTDPTIFKLLGSNDFSGGLRVEDGAVVAITGRDNVGTGAVTLANGGLGFAGALSDINLNIVGAGGVGTAGNDVIWNGIISGGTLLKMGEGTLNLNAENTHSSTVAYGENSFIALGHEKGLGSGGLTLMEGGGLKLLTNATDLNRITIASGVGVIDTGNFNAVSADGLTGILDATLAKQGSGTLTLAGSSVFLGNTEIRQGTLQLGDGGLGGGSLRGTVDIAGGAKLVVNRSDSVTMSNTISGEGSVTKNGSGTLTLNSSTPNTFNGGLLINEGYVAFNDGKALGLSLVQLNGGGLDFGGDLDRHIELLQKGDFKVNGGTYVSSGDTFGVGQLVKTGSGTLVFNGVAEHTGGTQVAAGTLQIGDGVRGVFTGDVDVLAGAKLAFGRSDISQYDGVVSGGGNVIKLGDGQLVLTNDHLFNGTFDIQTGSVRVGLGGTSGSLQSDILLAADTQIIFDRSDDSELAGTVFGSGTFQQMGTANLTLTGLIGPQVNTHVARGTLTVGNGGTNGYLTGAALVDAGSTLAFNRSDDFLHSAAISGSGALAQNGTGTLVINGDALHEGGTLVNSGTLQIGNGGTTGQLLSSGNSFIAADAQLIFNRTDTVSQSGAISGAGMLVQGGTGTLEITGVASHTGGTLINSGTLQIGNGGLEGELTGSGLVYIEQDATLNVNRDGDITISSATLGAGELVKEGAGRLVLTSNAMHTGTTTIAQGQLQVGQSGISGSLNSEVDIHAGAELIFNRTDAVLQSKSISGDGRLVQAGTGGLILDADASHTGGTDVTGGVLQIGVGNASGHIGGNIHLAERTQLNINRSDTYHLNATLSGSGNLFQIGTGLTILDQVNLLTGTTFIRDGRLGADADNKLGQSAVVLDGGAFSYQAAFDDLRSLGLTANGGGLDTNGFDVIYGAQITGAGTFEKQGLGRLLLTGLIAPANTQILEGEVQVGNNDSSGSLAGDVDIAADATLAFARANAFSFSNVISGSGTFVQRGSGLLQLDGDNSAFTGSTIVEAGSLSLMNQLGGDVSVNDAAVLMGTGTVLGSVDVNNGGKIRPGVDIGQLNINGDLRFSPSSVFEVQVLGDSSISADKIVVGGTAYLDGKLQVLAGSGDYQADQRYTVLSANQLQGNFNSVVSDLAFLNAFVSKNNGDVELLLTRNAQQFSSVALTKNQRATSTALDQLDDTHPLAVALQGQNIAGAQRAYDGLSGDGLLSFAAGQSRLSHSFADLMSRRTSRMGSASRGGSSLVADMDIASAWQATRNGQPVTPIFANDDGMEMAPSLRVDGVWAEARTLNYEFDSNNSVGSPEASVSGNLLSVGVDAYYGDAWALGVSLASVSLEGEASSRQTEGDLSGFLLGAYSRWDSPSGFHVKSSISLGQSDISSTRRLAVPVGRVSGETAASSLNVALEAGLGLQFWRVAVRPFMGMSISQLEQDAYREAGSDGSLDIAAVSATSGDLRAGMELSRAWLSGSGRQWLQLGGQVALAQPWGDTGLSQTASFVGTNTRFTVEGTADDSMALLLRAGAAWFPLTRVSVWGGYEGRQSSDVSEHQGVFSLNYVW